MKKKSFMKKIMKILLPMLIPFLGVVAIATGLLAVVSFVLGIISGLFGANHKQVDISNYTTAQMISVIDDRDIVTEEMLDNMMIDRDSLKKILQGVEKANTEFATRDIKIQQKHEYLSVTKQEVKDKDGKPVLDAKGNKIYISSSERKTDYESYGNITVTNESIESAYKLYWQELYVFAVMRTLNYYGQNRSSGTVDGVDSDELQQAAEDAKEEYEGSASGEKDTGNDDDTTVEISKEDGTIVTSGVLSQFDGQFNPSTDWEDAFEDAARSTNLPVGLIKAIAWEESSFRERALSSAGAKGIMQLMPNGAGKGLTEEELYTAAINIKRGATYFAADCLELFDGDVVLALTGYNQGPYGVRDKVKNGTLKASNYDYAAKVLNTYFGNIGLTGEKLLSGNYTLCINGHGGVGVYDPDTGRLQLSQLDVNKLIDDYKAKFIYTNDVVGDDKDTYTFEESKDLSSGILNDDGGNENSETGKYSWYVPRSSISTVMLSYMDIYFNGADVTYSVNNSRWFALLETYWSSEYYDHDWFQKLVTVLPRGQEAIDDMNYYLSLSNEQLQTRGSIEVVMAGGSLGYYKPTTTNPYQAADEYLNLGVERKWHMTKSDLKIIKMSDEEIWKVLTGKVFSKTPKPYEVSESEMWSRMTRVTLPVWIWSGSSGLKKKPSKITRTVNNSLAYMFADIFKDIYEDPSQPVMKDVQTYNYRGVTLAGGKLSKDDLSIHSFGAAIDINPGASVTVGGKRYTNGFVKTTQRVSPTYSEWSALEDTRAKYELLYIDCPVIQIFKAYGFKWGGDYNTKKDGMHFSKVGDGTQNEGLQNHLKYFK